MSTSPPVADATSYVPLELCRPAPYNARVIPEQPTPALLELARSIRRTGQIQPAIVRPVEVDGQRLFEVVCGARRLKAATLRGEDLDAAGPAPEYLRAEVRELTDAQAAEICATENLEREDLTPFEEARAVEVLYRLYGEDSAAVASRLNRSRTWVATRVRLLRLTPAWRKALEEDQDRFITWTSAHLCEVVKLEPAGQDEFLKHGLGYQTRIPVADLARLVAERTRKITTAPFDTADESLVRKAGACGSCLKTTLSNPGLFDDPEEFGEQPLAGARCLDSACWQEKCLAHAQGVLARHKAEHQGEAYLVVDGWAAQQRLPEKVAKQARSVEDGVWGGWGRVKAGTEGAWAGVWATGPKVGQLEWFARTKGEARPPRPKPEKGQEPPPKPLAERRKGLERRRQVEAVRRVAELVEASDNVPGWQVLLALALVVGTRHRAETLNGYDHDGRKRESWAQFRKALAAEVDTLRAEVWREQIRPVLLQRLTYLGTCTDVGLLWRNATAVAELAEIDAPAILEEVTAALPEPKSWAKLNADGTPKASTKAKAEPKPEAEPKPDPEPKQRRKGKAAA